MWRTLFFILVALTLASSVWLTYDRVFVQKDYVLEYSVACDPTIEACFVLACDGEEDCEDYFYTTVRKTASDVVQACGDDLESCESASTCLMSDTYCEIVRCDSETEECVYTPPPIQEEVEEPSEEE